jgi:hypothetical protein
MYASQHIGGGRQPSPPMSKLITSPTRTLMTPRNPWSFFLNFFWSKIWMASMLSSVALLSKAVSPHGATPDQSRNLHVKHLIPIRVQCFLDDRGRFCLFAADSRHCERVRKSYPSVRDACVPFRISSSLALTENISLVEPVSGDNWNHGQSAETLLEV